MIFVTVGTEKFPFDRLIRYVDRYLDSGRILEDVFAQIGCSKYKPCNFQYCDFMEYHEMTEQIRLARVVITHAGIGSYLTCLNLNKVPIIFPRGKNWGSILMIISWNLPKK